MQSQIVRINPWMALAGVCVLASASARAASLHVTATDALSNKAYDLQFNPPGGTATALPGFTPLPASPKGSVRSIVYVANESTAKVDLIAADNRTSKIVRYAAATGTPITLWGGTGAGPTSPIGLSADSFGNVFAGRGDQGHPELWVLKNNAGTFSAPVLIDKTSFGPTGTLGSIRLMDTLVVRTSVAGGLGAGDLLVLLSDGRVMRYSAASISNFILHNTPVGTPTTLIAATNFANGHVPTSIAIWPKDGSLLIPTVDGAIRRYSLSLTPPYSTALPNFATGLGSESTGVGQLLGLIRTFVSSAGTFAVLDNPQKNKIFEMIAPEDRNPALPNGCPNIAVVCNPPKATITTVANPTGLALTDASAASTDCVNSGNSPGCSLLGGTITVGTISTINPPGNGSVIVVACTVDDPRFTPLFNGSPLHVSDYCPNYPDVYVPSYISGASGASGHAMAFLKFEEVGGYSFAPADLLVKVELSADALLGATNPSPACSQLALGWTPINNEGLIPENIDPTNVPSGSMYITELASHCGSSKGLTPGHSLMLVGAQIDPSANLNTLTNQKFDALTSTIQNYAQNMTSGKSDLLDDVAHGKTLFGANNLTTANQRLCAAHQAWTTDQTIGIGNFSGNSLTKLSALSAIKGRLENLVMHIQNRIIAPGSPPAWNDLNNPPQADPLPEDSTTIKKCDITAPTAPGTPAATEVSSDGNTATVYNVSWTASSDTTGNPDEGNAARPGPYASGIKYYHVFVDGNEQTAAGSPTTALTLSITIPGTSPTSHPVTITADDNATGGTGPNTATAATSAQCTDLVNNDDLSSNPDGVCDVVASPP